MWTCVDIFSFIYAVFNLTVRISCFVASSVMIGVE
jgi:hypothetical protein